jgi:hypothetical protein
MNKDKKPRAAAPSEDDLPPETQLPAEEELPHEVLAESENYAVWVTQESDGEVLYHLDLGVDNVTVHFIQEEWDEFVALMRNLLRER